MFGFIEPEFDGHDWWLFEDEDVEWLILVEDQVREPEPGSYQQVVADQYAIL